MKTLRHNKMMDPAAVLLCYCCCHARFKVLFSWQRKQRGGLFRYFRIAHWYNRFIIRYAAKKIIVLLSLISISAYTHNCYAQKVFDFNNTCQQAYQQITSLKLNAGKQLLTKARTENPNNLIPDVLDNYIDFYTLFFNEDPAYFKTASPQFDARLDNIESGPQQSPYYNFCRTVIYMQKALVEIKFGKQWAAGWDFKKAFSLAKDNKKKFPDFLPNNMVNGPMLIAATTIPDGYKWLAGLLGIKGNMTEGVQQMQTMVNSNDPLAKLFFNEASFYYCYMLYHIQNKPDEAFQYIQQRKLDLVNNHLLTYMASNLAINYKRTDYASQVIEKRNTSAEYLSTPVWDFEIGYIKLHHLELSAAAGSFEIFLNKFKGNYYVKDAAEKLSWCYYLQGNTNAAKSARDKVLQKGTVLTDADKQALKNAQSGTWPNVLLLKARLLNDGGYNSEALTILVGKTTSDFELPEHKLEFAYRVARIYDDQGRKAEAVKMYSLTIQLGSDRTEYYAARAALQIGLIYESQGKKAEALSYYQKCLNMKNHDYKDSIDQKAKAGLERCKK